MNPNDREELIRITIQTFWLTETRQDRKPGWASLVLAKDVMALCREILRILDTK